MATKILTKSIQVFRIVPVWLSRKIVRKLTNRQFLFIASIIVALWAGLTAVVLKTVVHILQVNILVFSSAFPWLYILAPLVGISLTLLFIKFFLNGELTRGTSHVLLAIAKKSSILGKKETYSHAVTSALTVGMGGSAGLESPIVQTGSAIGSTFASFFPIGYRDRTLMLACGAAAGIAAAFNAPITGVLFALEVLLVDINISSFIPLLIAGATGALCSKVILHEEILLSFTQVKEFNYTNIPFYLVLGIVSGMVAVFYVKALIKTQQLLASAVKSKWLRLMVGGLLLGGLIFLFPAFFSEGYIVIRNLASLPPEQLFTQSFLGPFVIQNKWMLASMVLVLALLKVLAVGLTLGSGGNGGNFAPSLFVGACLGFAFSTFLVMTGFDQVPVSNFCLVGMAGVLTGIFHSPLTAIFLIAEITGGYGLMIPLMIVSALSSATARFLAPRSLDETILHEQIKDFSFDRDMQLLSRLSMESFIERDFISVKTNSTMRELVDAIAHSKRNIFPVLDEQSKLMGIIALEDIREMMFNTAVYDTLLVDQLMRKPQVVASLHEDMASIMEKFDKSSVWNIPVVNNEKYVGFISKSRIFSNYRERLKSH